MKIGWKGRKLIGFQNKIHVQEDAHLEAAISVSGNLKIGWKGRKLIGFQNKIHVQEDAHLEAAISVS